MYRWSACPGSVRMSKGITSQTSEFAAEGTFAHEVAAAMLTHNYLPTKDIPEEMKENLTIYFNEITRQLGPRFVSYDHAIRAKALYVEHRFDISSVYPGCFGTADAVVWDKFTRTLYVTDLKYGAGIAVEVAKNAQLLYYALGALITLKLPVLRVVITVVQPRCPHQDGPVRSWTISAIDLLDFEADLVQFAKATEAPDAPLVTGGHCRFCPAAGVCPQVHKESTALAVSEFSPTTTYSPQNLADTLDKLDMIEAWCKSVRAFAYAEAQHGRTPPGYKLVSRRPTRKWVYDEKETVKAIVRKAKIDPNLWFNEPTLISPAQAEKVLKANNLPKDLLEDLWASVSSGVKLVRSDSKEEPVMVGPSAEFTAL